MNNDERPHDDHENLDPLAEDGSQEPHPGGSVPGDSPVGDPPTARDDFAPTGDEGRATVDGDDPTQLRPAEMGTLDDLPADDEAVWAEEDDLRDTVSEGEEIYEVEEVLDLAEDAEPVADAAPEDQATLEGPLSDAEWTHTETVEFDALPEGFLDPSLTVDGLPDELAPLLDDSRQTVDGLGDDRPPGSEPPACMETVDGLPLEADEPAGMGTIDDIGASAEERSPQEQTLDDIRLPEADEPAGMGTIDDIGASAEERSPQEQTLDDIRLPEADEPTGMGTLDDVDLTDPGSAGEDTVDERLLEDPEVESLLAGTAGAPLTEIEGTIEMTGEELAAIRAEAEADAQSGSADDADPPAPSKPLSLGPGGLDLPADEKGTVSEISPEWNLAEAAAPEGRVDLQSPPRRDEKATLDDAESLQTHSADELDTAVDADGPATGKATSGSGPGGSSPGGAELLRTLDSDEFEPLAAPYDTASDRTLDSDEFVNPPGVNRQTLDSLDVPADEQQGQRGEPRIDQTLDSVDLPPGLSASVDRASQTVDDVPATADASQQTLDDVPPDSPGADDQRTIDQTMDSADFPSLPFPPGGPLEGASRIDQTLDSVDLPPDAPVKSNTVEARAISQTLDSTEFGPVDAKASGATLESGEVSAEIPPEDSPRIRATWQGAVGEATPMTSIRAELTLRPSVEDETSLVIQHRKFGDRSTGSQTPVDYQVVKQLGQGGMGVVYAAKQTSIDRTVALKMLKAETAKQKVQRNKFLSEAVVTGDLEHPNIVPIYDLGMNDDGALYYAMKRVVGTPWDEVVRSKGLGENLEILMKVADAVGFAHARKVIHRDLKPENVMLGGYGEVLVMDWGLAIPSDGRKIGGIKQSVSMGGTPAYMAPEMAAGPFEKISIRSDIYLLGAMLYEIISGKPPHTGRDVMKCLFAAAKNEIQQTTEKGELVEIALRAMATEPENRFGAVSEFQEAIRRYLSHSESIKLSDRAAEDLLEARDSKNYEDFARARFGFMEAFELWSGNDKARQGVAETSYLYASTALEKGDYDLALGLLDQRDEGHQELGQQVELAQKERDQRQLRLKQLRRWSMIGLATFLLVVLGFSAAVSKLYFDAERSALAAEKSAQEAKESAELAKAEKVAADIAREDAVAKRLAAVKAEAATREALKTAEEQRSKAEASTAEALAQKKLADENAEKARVAQATALVEQKKAETSAEEAKVAQSLAEVEKNKAEKSADDARKAKLLADAEREKAVKQEELANAAKVAAEKSAIEAKKAQDEAVVERQRAEAQEKLAVDKAEEARLALVRASREQYSALIGLASAKIEENAFGQARSILEQIAQDDYLGPLRNWEWGRLKYLCQQSVMEFPQADEQGFALEAVALVPSGTDALPTRFVVGGDSRDALVYDIAHPKAPPLRTPAAATRVDALAVSRDGSFLATAGDNPEGSGVRIGSVKLWAAPDYTSELREIAAHPGERIRSLDFSRDGKWLLTGASNGVVRIWNAATGEQRGGDYRGHRGAVYSARFSPNGKSFVTAGHDGVAVVWNASDHAAGKAEFSQAPPFRGHTGPVYAADFSPDGKRVVTGGEDKRILLWDPALLTEFDFDTAVRNFKEGKKVEEVKKEIDYRELEGDSIDDRHTAAVRAVRFSDDGVRIISASQDNTVKVWRADTLELYKTLRGHGNPVSALSVSPTGERIVSVGYDETQQARVWDIEQYSTLAVLGSQELEGHHGAVLAAAFAQGRQGDRPAGQVVQEDPAEETLEVVTASADRTARTWKFRRAWRTNADGKKGAWSLEETSSVEHKEGHRFLASSVVFFPPRTGERQRIATGAGDNTVRIWDMERKVELAALSSTGREGVVDISADGKLIATGSNGLVEAASRKPGETYDEVEGKLYRRTRSDGWAFKLWDADGKYLAEIQGQDAEATALRFVATSERPHLLAVGDVDGDIRLWDCDQALASQKAGQTPSALLTLQPRPHQGRVVEILFLPGLRMFSGGVDCLARVYDLKQQQELARLVHPMAVTALAATASGDRLLTGCEDGKVRLWKADGTLLWTFDLTEYDQVSADPMSASLRLGAVVKGEPGGLRSKPPLVRSLDISADGKSVLATLSAGEMDLPGPTLLKFRGVYVQRFNLTDQAPTEFKRFEGQREFLEARFAPFGEAGNRLIAAVGGDEAMLWREQDRGPRGDLRPNGALLAARFNSQGDLFVTASDDGSARIWSVPQQHALLKLEGHRGVVYSAVFSHNDAQVLTSGADGTARLWDARSGAEIRRLPLPETKLELGPLRSAVFSNDPQSQYLLTAGADRVARVWDTATGELLFALEDPLEKHTAGLRYAEFSHDNTKVVTASDDNTALLWEIDIAQRTSRVLHRLTGHTAAVTAAAFSPDDSRLLTASDDFTARLWNVDQGKELMTLKGHKQEVTDVDFSQAGNGRYVVTASRDGSSIVWMSEDWSEPQPAAALNQAAVKEERR
ncbi:WD40 repeat domain-containing serine/threonine protein kinase [Lignipirellula cremea]|uniref:Serine/threonine-protein kinase PknD n=1 Tax=Lignipirellula cremea TaxID=2528010 RepID=A0A518DSY1_9BACT|nr:protein kinase [Lignipirellula cremea]QDU94934.1 Serine/threonine-protein kinase PknD [Lignipirellula cremea]